MENKKPNNRKQHSDQWESSSESSRLSLYVGKVFYNLQCNTWDIVVINYRDDQLIF